jgi:glycosyltransferase involved in cell wall biosynthesis
MPAFNAQETIKLAARSALISMNSVSELVIYLDGCTDNTLGILETIRDSRIRIVVGQEKIGPAAAAQALLEEAKFEYIARLDSDDVSLPWRLRSQYRAMLKNKSDFEFTNIISFGSSLRFRFRYNFLRGKLRPVQVAEALLEKNAFVHSTAFFKKSSVEALGGYRSSAAEDYDLWLRASISDYRLARSRLASVLYRVHPKQISRSNKWLFAVAHDEILNESYIALKMKVNSTESAIRHDEGSNND